MDILSRFPPRLSEKHCPEKSLQQSIITVQLEMHIHRQASQHVLATTKQSTAGLGCFLVCESNFPNPFFKSNVNDNLGVVLLHFPNSLN